MSESTFGHVITFEQTFEKLFFFDVREVKWLLCATPYYSKNPGKILIFIFCSMVIREEVIMKNGCNIKC